MAIDVMRTHSLGQKILIKPRDNLKGIGVSFVLNTLALFSKHMGWLTIFIPNAKNLCHNTEYLIPSSRDPFFFDQPVIARRFLENLVKSQRPVLEQFKLKKNYTREIHGYSLDDIRNSRHSDYLPLEISADTSMHFDETNAAIKRVMSQYFSGEKSAESVLTEALKLQNIRILDDDDDSLSSEGKVAITRSEFEHAVSSFDTLFYDSKFNPSYHNLSSSKASGSSDEDTLSLYDLAKFGLDDQTDDHVTNIAIDLLHEVRLNDE